MNKVLVILGSTATGKTDLALQLAGKFQGELISCDSRQVYKDLDLGTGKLPGGKVSVQKGIGFWILDGIKIWMYDVINPKRQYTVFNYVKDATLAIEEIQKKGKLPIIVGGTGLYLKGLLYGFSNLEIPLDKKLRSDLSKLSLNELQKKLQNLSIKKWESLNLSDQKNPRRLVRAIELEISPRRSPSDHLRGGMATDNILKIGLNAPKEVLYQRIDERVISRIEQGMVNEAGKLYKDGLSLKRMRQLGLEYGVLADYLEKKIDEDDLGQIMQRKIHNYAKRQITWFKKEQDVNWFDITEEKYYNELEKLVAKWYYSSDASQD